MRQLSPSIGVLIASVLAAALFVYVFGPEVFYALGWACLGLLIGWLGSLIGRRRTQRAILLDLLAGAVGAVGGLLVFGAGSLEEGGPVERVLWSIIGSVLLVFVVGKFGRERKGFTLIESEKRAEAESDVERRPTNYRFSPARSLNDNTIRKIRGEGLETSQPPALMGADVESTR